MPTTRQTNTTQVSLRCFWEEIQKFQNKRIISDSAFQNHDNIIAWHLRSSAWDKRAHRQVPSLCANQGLELQVWTQMPPPLSTRRYSSMPVIVQWPWVWSLLGSYTSSSTRLSWVYTRCQFRFCRVRCTTCTSIWQSPNLARLSCSFKQKQQLESLVLHFILHNVGTNNINTRATLSLQLRANKRVSL